MVDATDAARRGGRARAAHALRRPRLHDDRAPLGAPRRGAEPRASRDRLRPPLRRRAGLLEGGDGACRAHLSSRRRAAASAAASRFSSAARRTAASFSHLPVDAIHPNPRQPRKRFEPEATSGLAASIRHQGVLQPIVVRPRRRGRLRARSPASAAGAPRGRRASTTLPAVVREADDRDALLLGLVENVARENLSPVEEARAYAALIDEFELSLGDVAERVGRSKPAVSNRLRLLELPEEVLWMLARGELTEGHARAVLALPDDEARIRLARRIARDGMTVRAAEQAARDGGARRRPRAHAGRPGARRARPRCRRAAHGPAGARLGRQARAPLRRRDAPRRARRGPRGAVGHRRFGREAGRLRPRHGVAGIRGADALFAKGRQKVGDPGLEPGASALSERRSNRLS